MISRELNYLVGQKPFGGHLTFDDRRPGKRPGVLVLHEGDGLGKHTRARADLLAELGYAAYAPDLYGEHFASREHGVATIMALVEDSAPLRARTNAALAMLKSQDCVNPERTAAIGFCFGGFAALELARSGADLSCTVCFHGGLGTKKPAGAEGIRGRILVCTGADDPHVPLAQRASFEEEMRSAAVDWQMIIYGGAKHAFTNPDVDPVKWPGSAYHRLTDESSWAAMRQLFHETMGGLP